MAHLFPELNLDISLFASANSILSYTFFFSHLSSLPSFPPRSSPSSILFSFFLIFFSFFLISEGTVQKERSVYETFAREKGGDPTDVRFWYSLGVSELTNVYNYHFINIILLYLIYI